MSTLSNKIKDDYVRDLLQHFNCNVCHSCYILFYLFIQIKWVELTVSWSNIYGTSI